LAAGVPRTVNSFAIDADSSGPAAFRGTFHALAAYDGGGPAEDNLCGVEIHGITPEVKQFAASCAGVGRQTVERKEPVRLGSGKNESRAR
jgi:hypothetical protein